LDGVAGMTTQCDFAAMSKKRDAQIVIRVSRTLRAALEDEALADGDRGLSGIVRRILIDHAARRITEAERARLAASQHGGLAA
jgi:hypothetical protein